MGPQPQPAGLPKDYPRFLGELKTRIREARLRATLAVNRELIELYFEIGRRVTERQRNGRWGAAVIECLSRDIRAEFPGIKGFSARNIWFMRSFFHAWSDPLSAKEAAEPILKQPASELSAAGLPEPLGRIPWSPGSIFAREGL